MKPRTAEQRQHHRVARLRQLAVMTDEQKSLRGRVISEALKAYYQKPGSVEKNSAAQKRFWQSSEGESQRQQFATKLREVWEGRSDQQRAAVIGKRRTTIKSRTPERKEQFRDKRRAAFAKKSQEELQAIAARTVEGLRRAWAELSPEQKMQRIELMRQGWTNDVRRRASEKHILNWKKLTPEQRVKHVQKVTEARATTQGLKGYLVGAYFSFKAGICLPYQSSYELAAYRILDSMPAVVRFDRCHFMIPYRVQDGGAEKCYFPDILVEWLDGKNEVIEIKPSCFVTNPSVVAKAEAARLFCNQKGWLFNIWTERQLGLSTSEVSR